MIHFHAYYLASLLQLRRLTQTLRNYGTWGPVLPSHVESNYLCDSVVLFASDLCLRMKLISAIFNASSTAASGSALQMSLSLSSNNIDFRAIVTIGLMRIRAAAALPLLELRVAFTKSSISLPLTLSNEAKVFVKPRISFFTLSILNPRTFYKKFSNMTGSSIIKQADNYTKRIWFTC